MEKMTTISTTYARIAIILLALNFVFTGYAITKLATIESTETTKEAPASQTKE
jgi:hypothetical protein|tara:strand:- start:64 stop:222 length:159 start_codon:yes stop_codon:yes gene_type:complete